MATGDKQNMVGRFYEDVAHRLLGGEILRNEDGDIGLDEEGVTVEVKSTYLQSSYGFRLCVAQIADYGRLKIFRYDRAWYTFFAYDNPKVKDVKRGKVTNALARYKRKGPVKDYLAERTRWGLILDHSIIQRLMETRKHSTKSVMGHPGKETIDLKAQRDIYPLTNGGLRKALESLGLNPDDFAVLECQVLTRVQPNMFEDYSLGFPVRVVVPQEEAKLAQKIFARQGFSLKREHSH